MLTLLWKFRWYSLINQVIIWGVIGVVFGALLQRYLGVGRLRPRLRRKRAPVA